MINNTNKDKDIIPKDKLRERLTGEINKKTQRLKYRGIRLGKDNVYEKDIINNFMNIIKDEEKYPTLTMEIFCPLYYKLKERTSAIPATSAIPTGGILSIIEYKAPRYKWNKQNYPESWIFRHMINNITSNKSRRQTMLDSTSEYYFPLIKENNGKQWIMNIEAPISKAIRILLMGIPETHWAITPLIPNAEIVMLWDIPKIKNISIPQSIM